MKTPIACGVIEHSLSSVFNFWKLKMKYSLHAAHAMPKLVQWCCLGSLLFFALASMVNADERRPRTLAEQLIADVKEGKIKANAEDSGAVNELIIKRNIPISYKTINTLMTTPNAFGPGAACATCHNSNDAAKSYRGLDLSTCRGIIEGSTEEPKQVLFVPGTDPKRDVLIRRLRNNRMPLGAGFHLPSDTPSYLAVKNWILDGAKDDENYKKNVGPLFKKANAFGPNTPACTACHMSNQEPPSFHELNLRTHAGVMLGADSVAKGVDKATKVVVAGSPEKSFLWQHLSEDRMPPGISPGENRDHPSTSILSLWIKQGAKCE
jgi:cytochrome c553